MAKPSFLPKIALHTTKCTDYTPTEEVEQCHSFHYTAPLCLDLTNWHIRMEKFVLSFQKQQAE